MQLVAVAVVLLSILSELQSTQHTMNTTGSHAAVIGTISYGTAGRDKLHVLSVL